VRETWNAPVARDPAGPDRLSRFFAGRKQPGGFLRARTLPQKMVISERICQLVFSVAAVYTIGLYTRIIFLPIHYKKTGGAFLYERFGKQRSPWSKKPGRS
jgi:hypothetical protein